VTEGPPVRWRTARAPSPARPEDAPTFVFEQDESACPATSPETGAPFFFWHPDLVTLHVWAWYPNPDGIYASMNRWVRPFNDDHV
jgi:hypothetical protein